MLLMRVNWQRPFTKSLLPKNGSILEIESKGQFLESFTPMSAQQYIFLFLSVFTLGSAFAVVTNKNLFHAALALMVTFLGVAGFYVMLDAGFMAAAQLMVYIGAISILIIFAIMMTRRLMQAEEPPFNSQVGLGLFGAIAHIRYVILCNHPLLVFRGRTPQRGFCGYVKSKR